MNSKVFRTNINKAPVDHDASCEIMMNYLGFIEQYLLDMSV